MKTVEELFKEIEASKDLQKELTSIGKGKFAEVEVFRKNAKNRGFYTSA